MSHNVKRGAAKERELLGDRLRDVTPSNSTTISGVEMPLPHPLHL
jgi:hypothetical protein